MDLVYFAGRRTTSHQRGTPMKTLSLCLLVVAMVSPSFAKDKKAKVEEDPTVWGMLNQNAGCVIFKEFRKTNARFWGVAITTKTYSGLEVIETQNYDLSPKKWIEDQESMDQLVRISVKDKIKFVKIPEKYTNNQLEKARLACKEPSFTP
jgi:hypothetical protein